MMSLLPSCRNGHMLALKFFKKVPTILEEIKKGNKETRNRGGIYTLLDG